MNDWYDEDPWMDEPMPRTRGWVRNRLATWCQELGWQCFRIGAALAAWEPTIQDGFGTEWNKRCPECGGLTMQVVRPGEAQCWRCG